MNRPSTLLSLAALALASGVHAQQNLYKVNNSDDLNQLTSWSTTSGSQTPNPGSLGTDNWYFNQATMTAGTKTVSLGGDMTIAGMALDWAGTTDPGSGNYSSLVINSGNTLTLNGGTLGGTGVAGSNYTATGILLNRGTGGTITINADVALGANQSWVTGRLSGTPLTVNGTVAAGAYTLNLNMVGNSSVVNTINGAITGTAKITKQREATLVLNGDNSGHSGGFQLGADAGAANVGVVRVGHNNALGTGAVTVRGTQLQAETTGITLANNFNVGAGGFRLGGSNSFAISGTTTIDLNNSRTIANYSPNGAVVTLGNIVLTGTATAAFDNGASNAAMGAIVVTGSISDTAGGGKVALSYNHNTTLNGTNTYTGATTLSGGRLAFNGSTVAASAWTMSGGTLTGTGTINGPFGMSGGTLALPGGATTTSLALNGGATITNSPTVVFQSAPVQSTVYDIFTYGGTLTGAGNLQIPYRGTRTDTGTKYTFTAGEYGATRTWNTTTGTWDVATTANFAEGDQLFYATDKVTFGDIASDSVVTLTGTLLPGSVTVSNSANTYTFQTGTIGGTTGLTKSNAGNLLLSSNANSFTGNITINGGTVTGTGGAASAGTTSTFGYKSSSRTITVNSGATLWLTSTTGSSNTFGGGGMTVTQIPTLVIDGGSIYTGKFNTIGNVTMRNGGALINSSQETSGSYKAYQFIGDITVDGSGAGVTMSNSGNNVAATGNHLKGGGSTTFTVGDITGSSAADLTISSALLDGSGDYSGKGALIKAGAGTMVLSGSNTYTGNTTINDGTLELTSTGKMYNGGYTKAIVTINTGGTWRMPDYSYGGVGQLADYAEHRVLNGGTIEVTGGTHSSGQDFTVGTNGGTFRYTPADTSSTLTLVGNNNSDITVNGALTFDAVGNITVDEPADTNSGIIAGTGSLTKTGAGTLTLNGTNTYAGVTNVNAGTLAVNGSIASSSLTTIAAAARLQGTGTVGMTKVLGTLAPGNSIGTLTISGDLELLGVSDFEIDPDDLSADLASVTGGLTFGGTLNVTTFSESSGVYALGDTFDLFDFGSQSGTFGSVNLPDLSGQDPNWTWDQSSLYSTGTITVIPETPAALLGALGLLILVLRRRV